MHNAHVIKFLSWRRYLAREMRLPLAETFLAQWITDEIGGAAGEAS